MRVNSLKISGVGGIKELKLDFHSGFNVICGANGIGKTTILNIIADSFVAQHSALKRNASYEQASYDIEYLGSDGVPHTKHQVIKEFDPESSKDGRTSSVDSLSILAFSVNRMIPYHSLPAVPKDIHREQTAAGNMLKTDIDSKELKGWFENRILFSELSGSITAEQVSNLEVAKRAFGLLDEKVSYKTVKAGTLDIILSTQQGDIYFEYLSAGYKTCIFVVLGIIKEIEFRFTSPYIKAADFEGVVLIDEIDLHLHPIWQVRLVQTLKSLFPKIQFIVTTHSPSILQSMDVKELIPLTMDAEGNIAKKDLNLGEYGLQGWTIEEIMQDVMEMPATTSTLRDKIIGAFDKAMDDENPEEILKNYDILQQMLHPNSTLKKLLEIQIAGWRE